MRVVNNQVTIAKIHFAICSAKYAQNPCRVTPRVLQSRAIERAPLELRAATPALLTLLFLIHG
jgi:hypothetical protein